MWQITSLTFGLIPHTIGNIPYGLPEPSESEYLNNKTKTLITPSTEATKMMVYRYNEL